MPAGHALGPGCKAEREKISGCRQMYSKQQQQQQSWNSEMAEMLFVFDVNRCICKGSVMASHHARHK